MNHKWVEPKRLNLITSLTVIIFLTFSPIIARANEISKVIVRNKEFVIINVIEKSEALNQFEALWNKKEKLNSPTDAKLIYKIDITSKNRSTRWLYSPEGYVKVLSKAKVPTYQITSPDQFNKLVIGDNLPTK